MLSHRAPHFSGIAPELGGTAFIASGRLVRQGRAEGGATFFAGVVSEGRISMADDG